MVLTLCWPDVENDAKSSPSVVNFGSSAGRLGERPYYGVRDRSPYYALRQ